MKSKLLTLAILELAFFVSAFAQYVPNGGFESWETRYMWDDPESWNTGNAEAFINGVTTAERTPDSYSGNYAMRLQTATVYDGILFGYCFTNGMITDEGVGDTLHFEGGFPISASPDWIYGYFKYNIAANDTGLMLVSFKSGGEIISQNMIPIFGSSPEYTKLGFPLEAIAGTPDTAMIAFACSNPNDPMPGGWLQIDSLWFGNVPDVIPNADFEDWNEISYLEPQNWVTTNFFNALAGFEMTMTQSDDAHTGSYALRLESVPTILPSGEGFMETIGGFGIPFTGNPAISEDIPTFQVSFNPTALVGYYKFEPAVDDTALVFIQLRDSEENTYETGGFFFPAEDYQWFSIPMLYPPGVEITEVGMIFTTNLGMLDMGNEGDLGSVLMLDDLDLVNPCEQFPPYEITIVTEPTCDEMTATLDAGEGWEEIEWSTEETTREIEVSVEETVTITVAVYDLQTGCEFSDIIVLEPPAGCLGIEQSDLKTMQVDVYPNPSGGMVTVELSHAVPGKYLAEVMDITGKIIVSREFVMSDTHKKISLDLRNSTEGLYLLRVTGEEINYSQRLIKK